MNRICALCSVNQTRVPTAQVRPGAFEVFSDTNDRAYACGMHLAKLVRFIAPTGGRVTPIARSAS